MTKINFARIAIAVLTLLPLVWIALAFYLQGPPSLWSSPDTTATLALDAARIESDVRFLAGLQPNRSFENASSMLKAEHFIADRFKELGYEVRLQDVPIDDNRVFHNVIARYGERDLVHHESRDGGDASQELIVIGAHYDVAGEENPGADDNASGVAGLLELARLFNTEKPAVGSSIEFVAYALEEPPFFASEEMGSFIHARELKRSGAKVKLMISLEMLGYYSNELFSQKYPIPLLYALYPWTGDFIGVIGRPRDRQLTQAFSRVLAANSAVPVRLMHAPAFVHGIDFSDHRNYWAHGWPAAMITDTAFFRNEHYHQADDQPDLLDFAKVAQVVRGLYGALTHPE